MKRPSLIPLIACMIAGLFACMPYAQKAPTSMEEKAALLGVAESFFMSLKKGAYHELWGILSLRSREKIVSEIMDKSAKFQGESLTRSQIERDLLKGGEISKAYWDAFAFNCDPDMALKDSRWDVGKVRDDYGEVVLRYKGSERPAVIKLYREAGVWKFGLVESFWSRK